MNSSPFTAKVGKVLQQVSLDLFDMTHLEPDLLKPLNLGGAVGTPQSNPSAFGFRVEPIRLMSRLAGFSTLNLWRQDKGQAACAKAFVDAEGKGGESPIALRELLEVARVNIEIDVALR